MKLTRRDALVALGTTGGVAGAAGLGLGLLGSEDGDGNPPSADGPDETPFTATQRETAVAVASELYPADVTGVDEFVETYLDGRAEHSPERAGEIASAVGAFDAYCRSEWGGPFLDLSPERREGALTGMGLEVVDPRPAGTDAERVRYHVVDELLFALYASPTGGELLGIENPPGHPGGQTSYQRRPEE